MESLEKRQTERQKRKAPADNSRALRDDLQAQAEARVAEKDAEAQVKSAPLAAREEVAVKAPKGPSPFDKKTS